MTISEYDAFGPWIYEINNEYPIPSLFVPYVSETTPWLMSCKIPRNIERRKATPDMDLYDYVVSAYQDHLQILKRVGSSVEAVEVKYSEVEAIRIYECFLQGLCTIYQKNGAIEIPFNTVSIDIMMKLVDIIRSNCITNDVRYLCPQPFQKQITDVLFENLLRNLHDSGEVFQVGAYQPDAGIRYKKETLIQKVRNRIEPQSLQSALHLFCDKELLIIRRGKAAKRRNEYSYESIYIPIEQIRGIEFRESVYDQVLNGTILLTNHEIALGIRDDNTDAIQYYQAWNDVILNGRC